MVDNLLPEHVELPQVLDLIVHLVQLTTWMGRGGHTETFSFSELFHVIIVSPQSQLDLIWIWTALGLGLGLRGQNWD